MEDLLNDQGNRPTQEKEYQKVAWWKGASHFELIGISNKTIKKNDQNFLNRGKTIIKQKLGLQDKSKSKTALLPLKKVKKLTIWMAMFKYW